MTAETLKTSLAAIGVFLLFDSLGFIEAIQTWTKLP